MYKIFREAGININTDEEIDYIKFINFWIGNNDEWKIIYINIILLYIFLFKFIFYFLLKNSLIIINKY